MKEKKPKRKAAKAFAAALAISTVSATAVAAGDNTPKPNIPNAPMHKAKDKSLK